MKDHLNREIRYLAVQCCGQCPFIEHDPMDNVFRCRRHAMEPKVDPYGEPPSRYCYLLTEYDVIGGMVDSDMYLVSRKQHEFLMENMYHVKMVTIEELKERENRKRENRGDDDE